MADELASGVGADSLKQFLSVNSDHRIFDFSQVSLWEQCGQKYQFRYLAKLPDSKSLSAEFSTQVMHSMVVDCIKLGTSKFYNNCYGDLTYWDAKWRAYRDAIVACNPPTDREVKLYTIDNAKLAMKNLINSDRLVNFHYVNHETVYWRVLPGVARSVWLSKPDIMAMATKLSNELTNIEIKHSGWDINAEALPFDRQILSQMWTTNTTSSMRLFFWFNVGKPGSHKPVVVKSYIDRLVRDRLLMDEWLVETQQVVSEMNRAIDAGVFPKRAPQACHSFNKACPYISLCPLGVGARYVAESEPHENPLAYLGM